MPAADHQSNPIGIDHGVRWQLHRFNCAPAGRHPRPELSGRLTKNAFECAIELRERLKPDVVRDFANAQIRVQQPIARILQADARYVIGEL